MADVQQDHDLTDDDHVVTPDERKLNDIFDKMCRASLDEERNHLAVQLRAAVDAINPPMESTDDDTSYASERGSAVHKLTRLLQRLLITSDLPKRLAAIAAMRALITTTTESIHSRTQRTSNAIRALFKYPVRDMPTAKAAATLVSTLADIDSPLAARAVDHVLSNSINLISRLDYQSDSPSLLAVDRARAAMVITELASIDKAPKFVLQFQTFLRSALWEVVWDADSSVREQGVQGMQAILKTVVIRAPKEVSENAMHEVVDSILCTLRSYVGSPLSPSELSDEHVNSHPPSSSSSSSSSSQPHPPDENGMPNDHSNTHLLPQHATTAPNLPPPPRPPAIDDSDSYNYEDSYQQMHQRRHARAQRRDSDDHQDEQKYLEELARRFPFISSSQAIHSSVIHGSLRMLGSLIHSDETRPYMLHLASEICNFSLKFQTHSCDLVRQAVAEILPLLVRLNRAAISDDFLDKVHRSTMRLIKNKKIPAVERGRSLVSLANIWEQSACDSHGYMLEDMLTVCKSVLYSPSNEQHIPHEPVLLTISHLANVSGDNSTFEKAIREGLLMRMFNTSFTTLLVESVGSVRKAIPTLDDFVLSRLVNIIAATLKNGLPDKRTGKPQTELTSLQPHHNHHHHPRDAATKATLARTSSTSVLTSIRHRGQDLGTTLRTVPRNSFSELDMERRMSIASGPLEFFRQYPFSNELHRIDSSSSLSVKTGVNELDGLLTSTPPLKSLLRPGISGLDLFYGDVSMDKNNSPCVALKAIINYEFRGMKSLDFASFASEYVIGYVESNTVKIRALSVGASAKLMQSAINAWKTTKRADRKARRLQTEVQTVLVQLVLVAVADPSKDVRYVAIRSIDRNEFRPYLVQPEVLNTLFMCLHDESLGMRDATLSLIGRLGVQNPAYVLPALRAVLNHMLITLRLDGRHFARQRKEATELIVTLLKNAQFFVEPYMGMLVDSLVLRLIESRRTHDTEGALPVLQTIAEMGGTISRLDLKPYREQLVPLVVAYVLEVQGAELSFRRSALRAFAALVQNTGFVIRPYVEHPRLLPRLLEILRSETDQQVRLEVEALLGSLGAVGPEDHKYAALPIYSMGRRLPHQRGMFGDSQGRSSLRGSGNFGRAGSQGLGPGSQRSDTGSAWRASYQTTHSSTHGFGDHRMTPSMMHERYSDYDDRASMGRTVYAGERPVDEQPLSLASFAMGGVRLRKRLIAYTPEWSREELEFVSLVGKLDHPFSQNEDYFPSVLLDELHKLISVPKARFELQDACKALVNILISVGPRCTYFLPEVVPRMLWLIDNLVKNEEINEAHTIGIRHQIILMLAEIVRHAGQTFMPYAFDTVLLVWMYLRKSPSCQRVTIAFCRLLTRIRHAIGEEFKSVIPTIVPLLLETLAADKSPKGSIAGPVLTALESFCGLFEDYNSFVLQGLTEMFHLERSHEIRRHSLLTLIRIVHKMDYVAVLSNVVHPLMLILAGVSCSSRYDLEVSSVSAVEDGDELSSIDHEPVQIRSLAVLSGIALYEIGMRSPRSFRVYVPVVTKALKISCVKRNNPQVYLCLRGLLHQLSPTVVEELLDDANDPQVANAAVILSKLPAELVPPRRCEQSSEWRKKLDQTVTSEMNIAEHVLMQKWEVESHFKGNDWSKWISDLNVAMFQLSGCPAFRACARIAESYPAFSKSLFNPAFLACWSSPISKEAKAQICQSLDVALSSRTIPLNVLQVILNLFEFMDHDEKPLPNTLDQLSHTAYRCGALAKSLRYWEQIYTQSHGRSDRMLSGTVGDDGLIAIYEKLNHVESAVGMINHYEKEEGKRLQEQWYEKLQRWEDAYQEYNNELEGSKDVPGDLFNHPRKWKPTLGCLRCLNQMGEWGKMIERLDETRSVCQGFPDALQQLALDGKGLSVSFDLGLWNEFEDWLRYIDLDTYDGCFYSSVLHIRRGRDNPDEPSHLQKAEECIAEAERHLDLELTARVSEGYPRAYSHIVRSQTLVEMKEMLSYLRRLAQDGPSLYDRRRLLDVWNKRLAGCKRDRATWYQVLMNRTLVLDPIENKGQWLEYAIMCRKAKLLPMAIEVLHRLAQSYAETAPSSETATLRAACTSGPDGRLSINLHNVDHILAIKDLDLKFACIKHMWAMNERVDAYRALENCRLEFSNEAAKKNAPGGLSYASESVNDKKPGLAAEVFSKLSKWGHRLKDSGIPNPSVADPLTYAEYAAKYSPTWYKAWHYWAVMNWSRFESFMEKRVEDSKRRTKSSSVNYSRLIGDLEKQLLTEAVRGFFKAINLCGKSRLEDSLKVLTLWFRFGGHANMHEEFDKGFEVTNIARWLEVVPQIIARLHTPYKVVQRGVKNLLRRIGKAHPHVAVYPLTVSKSAGGLKQSVRSQAASEILEDLKGDHLSIVVQTEMVARELVRVAILWSEMWYEKLEEASKLYYVERDVDGMINTLAPLHAELEGQPETEYERQFVSGFGRELGEASKLCLTYQAERDRGVSEEILLEYISQAWHRYTNVFKKIQRHQLSMHELHLKNVSNGLDEATMLTLAVPGTYNPDEGVAAVTIDAFDSYLHVLQSKQRPRKLSMVGSNGNKYEFLLKGHEDLRQDERVMQVFDLINKLFAKSEKRGLLNDVGLKTYSVIALSANAGLIEWVPDCDTMHSLVKNFRDVRGIVANVEHRVMIRCAPEPERLTLLQKVELFEYMLQSTSGGDLSRVIWLRSRNSEMWLDRRTTYAKSLAITSMVGYLLGLGDRHPSNLMIERLTGKIMHIDFGDCFEVAMKREKYPERVPFRLTRMMVGVLEPCGVEGYFRHTSSATLYALRQKNAKESLMSMMEAFVYDPLIRWKLLGAEELTELRGKAAVAESAVARSTMPTDSHPDGAVLPTRDDIPIRNDVNGRLDPDSSAARSSQVGGSGASSSMVNGPQTSIEGNHLNADDENEVGGEAAAGPSSLHGLGRDVPKDISELVQSLTQTGSLAESLRIQTERERREQLARRAAAAEGNEAQGGDNVTGAGTSSNAVPGSVPIATPRRTARGSGNGYNGDSDDEQLFGKTPNVEARIRQAREFDKGQASVASFERFTNVIHEVSNERAQDALNRFADKLNGKDYEDAQSGLAVEEQVDRLVHDARNVENLCTLFLGWCAFW